MTSDSAAEDLREPLVDRSEAESSSIQCAADSVNGETSVAVDSSREDVPCVTSLPPDDLSAATRGRHKSNTPRTDAAALHDLFLLVSRREQTYRSQFHYVLQWRLWSAEALDVFFLDRIVSPSDPWPWWLKYNPFWLLAHYMLVLCFGAGCLLHCLLYQGYPVPDESPEERRFRIHYVYGFDAYLGACGWMFLAGTFLFREDVRYIAVEGVVLSLLWITGNALGLQAMYAQSSTGIRCFVAGQMAWTALMTLVNLFELVNSFSPVALYHSFVVLFFWIGAFTYMIPCGPGDGLWNLYREERTLGNATHCAVISVTVRVKQCHAALLPQQPPCMFPQFLANLCRLSASPSHLVYGMARC